MSLSPRRAKSVNAVMVKATTEIQSTKSLCQHFNFAPNKPNLTMVEKSEKISAGLEETNFFCETKNKYLGQSILFSPFHAQM